MKKQFLSALAAAALLAAVAPAALAQNVATVNGKSVPKSRVDALAQQVIRSGRQVTPEMQGQLKDEVIAREIFSQEAKARQLDTTEDYKTQLDLAAQSILIRELFADFQKKNPVTDEEAKAEYDRFAGANAGKEFKSRHILVEKEDQAKDIITKLKKGAKFEDLAKKFSKDPGSGAKGGDLDWANPSNFVKEFTEALIALGNGKFTDRGGCHCPVDRITNGIGQEAGQCRESPDVPLPDSTSTISSCCSPARFPSSSMSCVRCLYPVCTRIAE